MGKRAPQACQREVLQQVPAHAAGLARRQKRLRHNQCHGAIRPQPLGGEREKGGCHVGQATNRATCAFFQQVGCMAWQRGRRFELVQVGRIAHDNGKATGRCHGWKREMPVKVGRCTGLLAEFSRDHCARLVAPSVGGLMR